MGEVLDGRHARQAGFDAREAQRLQNSLKPNEPLSSPRDKVLSPKYTPRNFSRRSLLTGALITLCTASAITLSEASDAIQLPQSKPSPPEVPNPIPFSTPQIAEIVTIAPYLQDEIKNTKKKFAIFNPSAGSQAADLTDISLSNEILSDPNRREIEIPMAIVKGIVEGINMESDPKLILAKATYMNFVDIWLVKEENQEAVSKALDAYNPYSYLNQAFYADEKAELAAKLTIPSDLAGSVMTTWKVYNLGLIDLYNQMPTEWITAGSHGEGVYQTPAKEKSLTRRITDETYKLAVALSGNLPAGSASEQLKTVFPRLFDIRVNMGFSFS